MLLIDYVIHVP